MSYYLLSIITLYVICTIGCIINITKDDTTPPILIILGWEFFPTIAAGEYILEWIDYKIGDVLDIANYIFLFIMVILFVIPVIMMLIKEKINKNSKNKNNL